MIGYCFCGSFCTVGKSIGILRSLAAEGNDILPLMSDSVYETDTRFGRAEDIRKTASEICGKEIIHTIADRTENGARYARDSAMHRKYPCQNGGGHNRYACYYGGKGTASFKPSCRDSACDKRCALGKSEEYKHASFTQKYLFCADVSG